MAKTVGHTMRRYLGHKAILAERAQRKAIMIADDGADASDVPFWADAPEPQIEDVCDVGEIAYLEDMADLRAREAALLARHMRSCTCTPTMRADFDMCSWCELSSLYSDVYKERNGFRPRHHADWSGAELDGAIRRLYDQPFHDD